MVWLDVLACHRRLTVKRYLPSGGIIVLLGEVILEGSLSNLFGCKGATDDLLLQEPGLAAGHHLTYLQGHIQKALKTL